MAEEQNQQRPIAADRQRPKQPAAAPKHAAARPTARRRQRPQRLRRRPQQRRRRWRRRRWRRRRWRRRWRRSRRPRWSAAARAAAGGRGGRVASARPTTRGIESSVVRIYRCSKVVKGGRTFSFGALVVAGDRKGNIGIGYGKANEVPSAVEKATKDARKSMFKVNLKGTTIPHPVKGTSGASTVILVPARPGTGVTAGKSVRPCLELAGITDILSKAYGSTSPKNLVKATMAALRQLQNREQVEAIRGVELAKGAGELVTA